MGRFKKPLGHFKIIDRKNYEIMTCVYGTDVLIFIYYEKRLCKVLNILRKFDN